jgi:putative endonuclease
MGGSTRDIGQLAEDIACRFLEMKGFSILERNYRKLTGEIDIVAEKGNSLRFIEVKAISRPRGISREKSRDPEELAHLNKLRKLAKTATLYMEEHKDEREFQIDVVGILLDHENRTAKCRLFEQVLDEEL